jgi:hypothetical protein
MDDLSKPKQHQFGKDRGRGNLLGVAPYMVQRDYASSDSFFDKLNTCLSNARHQNWFNEKTIVLFPEYIGTWLALAGEAESIFDSVSLDLAERKLVFHHPLGFFARWVESSETGRSEAAFFRMKAKQMSEIYQDVFSQLAREYNATIVAGSIVLPPLHFASGKLSLTRGPLQNVSVVFQPDGAPHPHVIAKAFPTEREKPFTQPGRADSIPSFDTPAGRLGALICADSWYPQAYEPLKKQGIDILAVPSYDVNGMRQWTAPWAGYNGWDAPDDVNINDVKTLTEGEAWKNYSLAGRIASSGAKFGMNIFLRGKIFDQDLGGWPATVVRADEVFVEEQTDQAAMFNLWL